MATVPIDIVDAFADRPFTGNPAAIIPDAADLTLDDMLRITDELQMEAGFVLPPAAPDADVRLRFFTPRREAMLSGHVIVSAFVSLADRGLFQPTRNGTILHHETGVGLLPVVLTELDNGSTAVTFDLPPPRFGEPVPASEVATALGLPVELIKFADHRPQRVSCGSDVLVVPILDRNAARGAFTDTAAIRHLTDQRGVGGLACFCPETTSADVDLFCRFFYPSDGTDEDVVSGTSLGAIAAFCLDKGVLPRSDKVNIVTEQGHALGRPNRAEVQVHMSGPCVTRICLTATGAVVMRGEFRIRQAKAAYS